jgi:DNA processing protein
MVAGLGTRMSVQMIEKFRSPQAIFRASASELRAQGLPGSVAHSIASGCPFEDAVEQQERMKAASATLLPYLDPRYPPLLREIFDPPLVLYAKGQLDLLQEPALGIVGTRSPSPYGLTVAERLAIDLSQAGLVISSGMARGIDTQAHRATLQAGGKTIAVFGCGVDVLYPTENRKLRDAIAERGLLISEFPMGTPGYAQNFPIRNRIISGISLGILVIEGAQYSGSAITARIALDQGRELFAIPGPITSRQSWGPNLLIKDGAKLVQDWNDVLSELSPESRRRLARSKQMEINELSDSATFEARSASYSQVPDLVFLGPMQSLGTGILSKLRADSAMQLDELLESLEGFSSSEVIAVLFELELRGLIRQMPGKRFIKVWAGRG